jgi:hypothetical protein
VFLGNSNLRIRAMVPNDLGPYADHEALRCSPRYPLILGFDFSQPTRRVWA